MPVAIEGDLDLVDAQEASRLSTAAEGTGARERTTLNSAEQINNRPASNQHPPRPCFSLLTAAEFQKLADVPPEVEWFANLTNAHTRRAYETAVKDFMRFAGIKRPEEFRTVDACACHRLAR